MEGLQQLAELVAEGGSRISVMPGGGLTEENAATVARVTGGLWRQAKPAGAARAACAWEGVSAWLRPRQNPRPAPPQRCRLPAGCAELHGTFKRSVPSAMAYRHASVSFSADDWSRTVTDAGAVQRVKAQLAQLEGSME